jgi:hypothetical protein
LPHSPTDRPRLVVSADGSLAAIGEPTRIIVVDLPSGQPVSEIGTDRTAEYDFGWLGSPPRLLVLSRHEDHTQVHLLDPHGPESVAEIQLASAVALFATVGAHALVVGAQGAAVLTATDSHLTPYQFPARAKPIVAGAAANQFVVGIPGVIEEWDPAARVPKRRLRLPRPNTLTAVGGSERVVWMIAQQEPARIDVLPLINRGQPKTHDLPEPIAAISGHPRSDLLACIGAQTGRAFAIDLDGRTRLRSLSFPDIDHVDAIGLVIGRTTGVIAAQRGRPIAFAPLEARDPHVSSIVVPTRTIIEDNDAPRTSSLIDDGSMIEEIAPPPQRTRLESPFADAPKVMSLSSSPPSNAVPVMSASASTSAASAAASKTAKNLAARFAAVRERREAALAESGAHTVPTDMPPVAPPPPLPSASLGQAEVTAAASGPIASVLQAAASLAKQFMPPPPPATPKPPSTPSPTTSPSWRNACADWAESVIERRTQLVQPPAIDAVRDLALRFDLSIELQPALSLLYGAHLSGHDGIAPVVLANVLDFVDERRWAEALGRGELAAMHVATYEGSRVRLAPVVRRVLDELVPATGTLVGAPAIIAVVGACVLVERGTSAIEIAAQHAARAGGAILVGHDERTSAEVCFEARAIGAVAMLPASKFDGELSVSVIYVADDEGDALKLGLPRFA